MSARKGVEPKPTPPKDQLLPLPAVLAKAGIRKSRLYELINEGRFPKQALVGGLALWSSNEIDQWIFDVLQERKAS